jgi:hypothetical protein
LAAVFSRCQTIAGNVWAANGIGAVLAEEGRLAEAAEVLNAVQVSWSDRTQLLHVGGAAEPS